MAILVNQCPNKPRVNIGRDGKMSEQMKYLRNDPHWFIPFDHEVKAAHRKDMLVHVGGTVLFVAIMAGWILW
jgi:hypothetical protein